MFTLREVIISPGRTRAYDEAEWRDALVILERGEIELEWLRGAQLRLHTGDVLWLARLRLRALHNRGLEPAVLVAIARAC